MRRFSLAQLEAFLWICRLGTFRAAAERLNLTQPTVSLRIRELEASLGARLFERRGNGMQLSAEGSIMLRYAERGLDLFDEMEDRLRTGDPLQGLLRLGVSDTFAMTCLAEIVGTLEVTYPKLQIELTVTHSNELGDLLNRKKLDLAFLTEPRLHRNITVEPLGRSDVAWLSSPKKRIGNGGPVRPRDVAGLSILSVPPPSPLYGVITEWCTADGSPPLSLSTCNNIAVIARLVIAGVAVSVLPVCVVHRELASGALIRYRGQPELSPRSICAAYPSASRGPGIDELLRITRQAVAETGLFESKRAR